MANRKLKTVLGLGTAAVLGAVVGSKVKEKMMTEEQEKQNQYQYSYAPAVIEGTSLQEWERYKADFIANYGSKIINLANKLNDDLVKMETELRKKRAEYADMPDVVIPYTTEAMKNDFYRKGLSVSKTGQLLIPFVFLDAERFANDRDLGASYALRNAVKTSALLKPGQYRYFELDKLDVTRQYIRDMRTLIDQKMGQLFKDLVKIGIPDASFIPQPLESEKLYIAMTIHVVDDIRTLQY